MYGGPGTTYMYGGTGGDLMVGGSGTTVMYAGAGGDTLIASTGTTVMIANVGTTMYGNPSGQADTFVFP